MMNLNKKELHILALIADGRTSAQIADELCLSLPTIKWYRARLRTKFECSTSAQMIRKAIEYKII